MITECSICRKKFRFNKGNNLSMVSISQSGKMVLSHICEKCGTDEMKINQLITKNDKILDMQDGTVGQPC